jgi:hypothetical protein
MFQSVKDKVICEERASLDDCIHDSAPPHYRCHRIHLQALPRGLVAGSDEVLKSAPWPKCANGIAWQDAKPRLRGS